MCEELTGKKMQTTYVEQPRKGDHIWYISSMEKFQTHYPGWGQKYGIRETLSEILEYQKRSMALNSC